MRTTEAVNEGLASDRRGLAPCLVWFRHAPPGAGLMKVAGLPLVVRACLEADAKGFGPILVASPKEDARAIAGILATDPRLAGIELLPDKSLASALTHYQNRELVIFFGNTVWDRARTVEAADPLPQGCQAKAWGNSLRGWTAFARVRAATLDSFLDTAGATPAANVVLEPLGDDEFSRVLAPPDIPLAERLLLRTLRKPTDGIFSRFLSRPVSLLITTQLARLPVRPNQVTALVCLFGIAAAVLASRGTRSGFVSAALCWWAAAIFDGCDGELARLKYLGTPLGAWLDTLVDDLSLVACITSLAVGLARSSGNDLWLICGSFGILGFCLTYPPRWYLFAHDPLAGDHQRLAVVLQPESRFGFGAFAYWVKQTVVRSDFLPYFVMTSVLSGLVAVALVGLTCAMLAGIVETALTFFVWRPRWTSAGFEGSRVA